MFNAPRQLGTEGFSWWCGVVKKHDMKYKVGMVRVAILGKHDLASQDDDYIENACPLAQVILPTTSPSFEGVGDTPQLEIGSTVFGFYMDTIGSQPFILGTIPGIPSMDDNKHSLSYLARGKNDIVDTKLHPIEPDSKYAAEYPYNRVIKTRSGHVIELDDTQGIERINIRHKSGAQIQIDPDGNMTIKSIKDSFDIVGGVKNIAVTGDCNIESGGSLNVRSKSDINIVGQQDVNVSAAGRLSLNGMLGVSIVSGKDVAVDSAGGLHTVTGGIRSTSHVKSGNGITGYFRDASGKWFGIRDGIITSVKKS